MDVYDTALHFRKGERDRDNCSIKRLSSGNHKSKQLSDKLIPNFELNDFLKQYNFEHITKIITN